MVFRSPADPAVPSQYRHGRLLRWLAVAPHASLLLLAGACAAASALALTLRLLIG